MNQDYHEREQATRTYVLGEALAYAKRGIPVFPCKPGRKEPLTKHGFHDASTDPRKIHAWWNAHPLANIGIPTGKRSGILALDVDLGTQGFDSLEALEAEHSELPATTTIRTGGGGMHYYFRYPCEAGEEIRISAGKLGQGLDIRGESGYVVAPPSVTEGPYTVLEDLPLAVPPEWLLLALTRPHSAAVKTGSDRGRAENPHSSGPMPIGPNVPIHEGQRNDRLFRYGCSLRAQGSDHAAILEELENINARLCKPPLDASEVEKTASSAASYDPGNASPRPNPEVKEALNEIQAAHLEGRKWSGVAWKTPRSVLVTLIAMAGRHGHPVKDGVLVYVSVRQLALAASVGKAALTRSNGALDKLRDAGLIRSVKGSGTKSGGYVLMAPSGTNSTHSSTALASPHSGFTLSRPPIAPRLRYSKPVYESEDGVSRRVGTILRLGKSDEQILDILESVGVGEWITVADLGAALGIKQHRYLRRVLLPRLGASAVVECSEDAVRLRPDWQAALYKRREEDQEMADYERDKKKYAEQSRNYYNKNEARKLYRLGIDFQDIAHTLHIGMEDVRRLLDINRPTQLYPAPLEPDGFFEELERAEVRALALKDFEDFDFEDEFSADSANVEDFPEPTKPVFSPLAAAVRDYLERNPHRADETPSWIANTLWAYKLYPGKPTRHEVSYALEELGSEALQAVA